MNDSTELFRTLPACWVCGGTSLHPVHSAIFDFSNYGEQDPGLSAYTGQRMPLMRCESCGFSQPQGLPTLPDFFARMYDQRWAPDWMAHEYTSVYRDFIFRTVLGALARRVGGGRRRLLDVGSHVGRLLRVARDLGWTPEGVELNPQTAGYAAAATGLPIHRVDAATLAASGRRYDAATIIDVLEHIPEPVSVLAAVRTVLDPGGWIAVKVPNGPVQLRKEVLRARVVRGYRATVADNLVHVNHFTPHALALALQRAGFVEPEVHPAAPEIIQPDEGAYLARTGMNVVRRVAYAAARALPGALHTPLALHLQAYARVP